MSSTVAARRIRSARSTWSALAMRIQLTRRDDSRTPPINAVDPHNDEPLRRSPVPDATRYLTRLG